MSIRKKKRFELMISQLCISTFTEVKCINYYRLCFNLFRFHFICPFSRFFVKNVLMYVHSSLLWWWVVGLLHIIKTWNLILLQRPLLNEVVHALSSSVLCKRGCTRAFLWCESRNFFSLDLIEQTRFRLRFFLSCLF